MKIGKLKRYSGLTIVMALVFVLYAVSSTYADVLCVDADASGANDGTS